MKTGWWGGGAALAVLALGLACGAQEVDEALRTVSPDLGAPTDAAGTDGEEGGHEGPVSLLWLAEDGGACQLKSQDLPSGEPRNLAALGGPCPATWRIAIPAASSRMVVYTADRAWVLSKEGVRKVEGTKDGIDLVAFDGDTIVACGRINIPEQMGEDGVVRWTYEGKDYEDKNLDELGALLVRTWTLGDSGWTQKAIVAYGLKEGMHGPACGGVEGWPEGTVDLAPNRELEASKFRPATDAELEELKIVQGGGWYVSQQGGVAVQTAWLDEFAPTRPVVSRMTPSSPWALIPELNGDGSTTPYDISGPYLLINGRGKSVLRDVRSGKDVWTSTTPAVFWREGISLPILADDGEEGPGKAKMKGKVKMKAKMKAKAGQ